MKTVNKNLKRIIAAATALAAACGAAVAIPASYAEEAHRHVFSEVLEFDGDSGNNRVVPAVSYAERKHLAVACTGGDYAAGVAEIAADEH